MSFVVPFIRISIEGTMCHSFLLHTDGQALLSDIDIGELKPFQTYTVGNLDIIECKLFGDYCFADELCDEDAVAWHSIFDYQHVDCTRSFYEEFICGNIVSSEENGWYASNGINYGSQFISFYDIYVSISGLDIKTFKLVINNRANIENMFAKMMI